MEHIWGYGFFKRAYEIVAPFMEGYYAMIPDDYRGRPHEHILNYCDQYGMAPGKVVTSQDSVLSGFLAVNNLIKVSTFTMNAKYIGEWGEHSNSDHYKENLKPFKPFNEKVTDFTWDDNIKEKIRTLCKAKFFKMNIIHYTPTNYESGSLGGVTRFDHELRKVFPQLKSVLRQPNVPWFTLNPNETIVITDHSFIKEIPTQFKVIAVHHGMAAEHKQRNPDWSGDLYVQQQQGMKDRNKTWFVGISKFTQDAAKKHHDIIDDIVILHAVDTVPITKPKQGYNVIGDWRTPSKGRDLIQKLREECPEFIFSQLSW